MATVACYVGVVTMTTRRPNITMHLCMFSSWKCLELLDSPIVPVAGDCCTLPTAGVGHLIVSQELPSELEFGHQFVGRPWQREVSENDVGTAGSVTLVERGLHMEEWEELPSKRCEGDLGGDGRATWVERGEQRSVQPPCAVQQQCGLQVPVLAGLAADVPAVVSC